MAFYVIAKVHQNYVNFDTEGNHSLRTLWLIKSDTHLLFTPLFRKQ